MSTAAKQISWQEGGRNRGSQRRGSLELSKPKEGYVADNRHPKGIFFLKVFFLFFSLGQLSLLFAAFWS